MTSFRLHICEIVPPPPQMPVPQLSQTVNADFVANNVYWNFKAPAN